MRRVELETGDAKIAGDFYPLDGAPLVIFSHGGGQTRHSWRGACEEVWNRGFATLALDLRGHGESAWTGPEGYRLALFARDIVHFARAFGKRGPGKSVPVVAVGASFGGMASLLSAAEPDSPVDAVVIVDFVPRYVQEGGNRIRSFMLAHPAGFASLDDAARAIADFRGGTPASGTGGLARNLRRRGDGRWYWHWDPAFLQHIEPPAARTALLEDAARGFRGPFMLVHGLKSDVVDSEGVEALRAIAPQLEYVDVADAGHMVVNDRNDAFIDAIAGFVERNFASARQA